MPSRRRMPENEPDYNPEAEIKGYIEDAPTEYEPQETEDPQPDPDTDPKERDPLKDLEKRIDELN